MANSEINAKFRINPIELGIFSLVVLVFLNSAYNLIDEGSDLKLSALSPEHEIPSIQTRGPASRKTTSTQLLENTQLSCNGDTSETTTAAKIRFSGEVCLPRAKIGPSMPSFASRPAGAPSFQGASISVPASGHEANVFVDLSSGKYTTDYIPLRLGQNEVRVDFKFIPAPGKTLIETRTVKIYRN